MIRHRKWCKKGCGKRVIHSPEWHGQLEKYVCEECKTRYTANELGLVKKNSQYTPSRKLLTATQFYHKVIKRRKNVNCTI